MLDDTSASARSRARHPGAWTTFSTVETVGLFDVESKRPPQRARDERPTVPVPDATTKFQQHRSQQPWRDGAPAGGGRSVNDRIEAFRPTDMPERIWLEIQPLTKDWVRKTGATEVDRAKRQLTAVAGLLRWAYEGGLDLRPDLVLHVDTIEQFIVQGRPDLTDGSRTTYRSELRAVGEKVLGPATCPTRQTLIGKSEPEAPYSDHEFSDLVAGVRGLTTPHRRDNGLVLVSLAAGAGMANTDVTGATGTDVERSDSGVAVNITWGPNPRRVVVTAEWEDEVWNRAVQVGEHPMFHPGRTVVKKKDIPNFLDRLNFPTLPRLTTQRLRVTWIVRQLTAGVPVHVVAAAAGVGPAQIARYFRFMPDIDPAEADRLLRGLRT